MCVVSKHIFTCCGHHSKAVEECDDFPNRLDLTASSCDKTCKQFRPVAVYGWCPSCSARYSTGPYPLSSEILIRNFWAYKANRKWHMAVDPASVPREAAFSPYPEGGVWASTRVVSERPNGKLRRHEIRYEELAIIDAASQKNECNERCRYCKGKDRGPKLVAFGTNARIATLNWARVQQLINQSPTEQSAPSSSSSTEEDQLRAEAARAKAFDDLLSSDIDTSEPGLPQLDFLHPELIPEPLRTARAVEAPAQVVETPRRQRLSHPELVPAPLRPTKVADAPHQVVETPKRQPSPSEMSSVDLWMDESFSPLNPSTTAQSTPASQVFSQPASSPRPPRTSGFYRPTLAELYLDEE
ncbi:hypothetical protein F5X68DRAFT_226632 [Plectosphaerella plurivora]|uniref:Uncharacterized protein n=1 Tax=Plectosphaerella plurivora TaxID=936078 RepID=A0A9P9AD81_9PEZI|nr:hypothetical protein F5X68DRAFT_226632 [Plectosphaerella plurivora]